MKLTRICTPQLNWPFSRWGTLHDEIGQLFGSALNELNTTTRQPGLRGWSPAIDLWEDADNVFVKAELPGMKKEDINVSLHDGVLTLSGERAGNNQYKDAEVHRAERFVGRFERTVNLPAPVDVDKVRAAYGEGILTVTLPKTEAAKPRQIKLN